MKEEPIFSMGVSVRTSPGEEERQKRDLYGADLGNYIVLREMLDRFESRMVEYFFAGETAEERTARAEEIRLAIKDIPNVLWAENGEPCSGDEDCPPGQHCVKGVCSGGGSNQVEAYEVVTKAVAQNS